MTRFSGSAASSASSRPIRWGATIASLLVLTGGPALAGASSGERYDELVSVGDTNGTDVQAVLGLSPDGNAILWESLGAYASPAGANALVPYIGRRVDGAWTVQAFAARLGGTLNRPGPGTGLAGMVAAPDYTDLLVATASSLVPEDDDVLPGTRLGAMDVYRLTATGDATLLSRNTDGPLTNGALDVTMAGNSSDGSAVFIRGRERLALAVAPGAGEQVYRWKDGQLRAAGLAPDGSTLSISFLGNGTSQPSPGSGQAGYLPDSAAVSADGEAWVFGGKVDDGSVAQVYLRSADGSVAQLSIDRRTGATGTPSASIATFLTATPDLAQIFFESADQLTDDAPVGGGVYRYDRASGALTFSNPTGIIRVSADGRTLYFVSPQALTSGAVDGRANLYAQRDGQNSLIASLPAEELQLLNIDRISGTQGAAELTLSGLSADSRRLVFTSAASIAGSQPNQFSQVYLYDAADGTVRCLSCRPDGSRSQGSATLRAADEYVTATPRVISADGSRVMFTSADGLLPQDTNGVDDVYEWIDGRLTLLTTGQSRYASSLVGMNAAGTDLFFLTHSSLSDEDDDAGQRDIYDARLGSRPPRTPAAPCNGDTCQGPLAPPASRPGVASELLDPAGAGFFKAPSVARVGLRAIDARARRLAARTGRLTVTVRVSGPGTIRVSARALVAGHTRTVAAGSARASKASSVPVALRLSSGARKQLRHAGRLPVTVAVTAGGNRGERRTTLTRSQASNMTNAGASKGAR
jgi:hypothetical protein